MSNAPYDRTMDYSILFFRQCLMVAWACSFASISTLDDIAIHKIRSGCGKKRGRERVQVLRYSAPFQGDMLTIRTATQQSHK